MGANFGSVVLPQLIPRGVALELLYTGELIDMALAHRLGLVNHVFEPAELMAQTAGLARRIADNAPLSVQRMKAMAFKSIGLPTAAALRLSVGPDPYNSEDRLEGARASWKAQAALPGPITFDARVSAPAWGLTSAAGCACPRRDRHAAVRTMNAGRPRRYVSLHGTRHPR